MKNRSGKRIAKRAYTIGFIKGRRTGINKGASISPRQAYKRGYRAGAGRTNAAWTRKAAQQNEYYYQMGRRSK